MYIALAYSGGLMYGPGYLTVKLDRGQTTPFTSGVYADPAVALTAISKEIEREKAIDKKHFDPFYFAPEYTVLDAVLLIPKYTAIPTTAAKLIALGIKTGRGKFMVWSGKTMAIIDIYPVIAPPARYPPDPNLACSLRVFRTNDGGVPLPTPITGASSPDIDRIAQLWAVWVELIEQGLE